MIIIGIIGNDDVTAGVGVDGVGVDGVGVDGVGVGISTGTGFSTMIFSWIVPLSQRIL